MFLSFSLIFILEPYYNYGSPYLKDCSSVTSAVPLISFYFSILRIGALTVKYRTLLKSFFKIQEQLLDPALESKVKLMSAITALLLNAPEVGNKQLTKVTCVLLRSYKRDFTIEKQLPR